MVPTYRVRPSKPVALTVAAIGVIIVVLGIVLIGPGSDSAWLFWLWVAVGIFVAGYTLWAAFAGSGFFQKITSDQPPPAQRGMTTTQE
jgi:uncharacterized membrane protein HdeD (DUF308 family)